MKIWLVGLILALTVFSNVLYAANQSSKTYVSKKYGFKIDYPSNWEFREKVMNAEVVFLAPPEDASDQFRENVNVGVIGVPANTDLNAVKDATIQQLGNMVTNFNLVAEKPVTWLGNNAYAMVYTGTMGKYQLQWQQIFTIVDDAAYILTYAAETKSYNKFFPYFNQIAASFRFR
jgi:serine/threonine-protein kinase